MAAATATAAAATVPRTWNNLLPLTGTVAAGGAMIVTNGALLLVYFKKRDARPLFGPLLLVIAVLGAADGAAQALGRGAVLASGGAPEVAALAGAEALVSPSACVAVLVALETYDIFVMYALTLFAFERYIAAAASEHSSADEPTTVSRRARGAIAAACIGAALLSLAIVTHTVGDARGFTAAGVTQLATACGGRKIYSPVTMAAYLASVLFCLVAAALLYFCGLHDSRSSQATTPAAKTSTRTSLAVMVFALVELPFCAAMQLIPYCRAVDNDLVPHLVCRSAESFYVFLAMCSAVGYVALPLLLARADCDLWRETGRACFSICFIRRWRRSFAVRTHPGVVAAAAAAAARGESLAKAGVEQPQIATAAMVSMPTASLALAAAAIDSEQPMATTGEN